MTTAFLDSYASEGVLVDVQMSVEEALAFTTNISGHTKAQVMAMTSMPGGSEVPELDVWLLSVLREWEWPLVEIASCAEHFMECETCMSQVRIQEERGVMPITAVVSFQMAVAAQVAALRVMGSLNGLWQAGAFDGIDEGELTTTAKSVDEMWSFTDRLGKSFPEEVNHWISLATVSFMDGLNPVITEIADAGGLAEWFNRRQEG